MLAFSAIVIAAFLTRLWPLAFSSYPFNNDGLTECGLAAQILGSGHLSVFANGQLMTTHSTAIPAMNVVIAYASSALGINPYEFGQVLTAVVAMVTISGIFLLGRSFSGNVRGGIASALAGLLMGTFVFTTGSVWKEAFGFAFISLLLIAFVRRNEPRFRMLCLTILILLPLVHHLVAVIALLMVAYPVGWGWIFALLNRSARHRHFDDILMVVLPTIWLFVYYSGVSLGRFEDVLSTKTLPLIFVVFAALTAIQIAVFSIKNHSRFTFAPIPGIVVVVLLVLDYYGFLFPYEPAAPLVYFLFVAAFGALVSIAWYGTEFAFEVRQRYRAVQFGLLLAPATVIGFSVVAGITLASQRVIYRSFDFADIFIFTGIGLAISSAFTLRKRAYPVLAAIVIVFVVISFPFGYYSDQTLGVRHDTQSYEVDALMWFSSSQPNPHLVSDERMAYVSVAVADIPANSRLVDVLAGNVTLAPRSFVAFDGSYLTSGVSDYPRGYPIIPFSNSTRLIDASDVQYIGGPRNDPFTMMATSGIGHTVVFGPFVPP